MANLPDVNVRIFTTSDLVSHSQWTDAYLDKDFQKFAGELQVIFLTGEGDSEGASDNWPPAQASPRPIEKFRPSDS